MVPLFLPHPTPPFLKLPHKKSVARQKGEIPCLWLLRWKITKLIYRYNQQWKGKQTSRREKNDELFGIQMNCLCGAHTKMFLLGINVLVFAPILRYKDRRVLLGFLTQPSRKKLYTRKEGGFVPLGRWPKDHSADTSKWGTEIAMVL